MSAAKVVWSPDPETIPWLEVSTIDTFVAAPITAEREDEQENKTPASRYDFELIGPRPKINQLQGSQSSAGLVLSIPQISTDLNAPMEIEYQVPLAEGGWRTGICSDFPEVPPEADEIIRFEPHREPSTDWTFRVTAHFEDGSESAEFVLRVHANWTPGRDALKEAVDARRHKTRR